MDADQQAEIDAFLANTEEEPNQHTCIQCGETFPRTFEYFHKGGTSDGMSPICKPCARQRTREWKAAHPNTKYLNVTTGKMVDSATLCTNRTRERVLEHYGGKPPRCACCGVRYREFLSLHHINGGGGKLRRDYYRNRHAYFRDIERAGFPEEYSVLCHNCNQSLGYNGYCPHDLEDKGSEPSSDMP